MGWLVGVLTVVLVAALLSCAGLIEPPGPRWAITLTSVGTALLTVLAVWLVAASGWTWDSGRDLESTSVLTTGTVCLLIGAIWLLVATRVRSDESP